MQSYANKERQEGKTIALVPTMGYLHEGHLSLIRMAKKHSDVVVMSLFVNPTQFGPNEDFEAYPRNFERDRDMALQAGADIIFAPDVAGLYGEHFQTYVSLEKLPNHLCGLSRPIHFRGVATVVTKLFNIVKPHAAIFGLKDYQQVQVIRQMVKDLNLDVEIIGAPIVREPDGLAMSSRNTYLTTVQRQSALCLSKSLALAQSMVDSGMKDAYPILQSVTKLIESHSETAIDYIAICDPETLENVHTIGNPVLMAIAVKVGKTRLIDNNILQITHSR